VKRSTAGSGLSWWAARLNAATSADLHVVDLAVALCRARHAFPSIARVTAVIAAASEPGSAFPQPYVRTLLRTLRQAHADTPAHPPLP
jgi:hypothetical protein